MGIAIGLPRFPNNLLPRLPYANEYVSVTSGSVRTDPPRVPDKLELGSSTGAGGHRCSECEAKQ